MWLALLDRLKTKDRLFKLNIGTDDLCPVCGSCTETSAHLFFNYTFSVACRQQVRTWLGFQQGRNSIISLLKWIQRYDRSKVQKTIMYAAIACLVYNIWRVMNSAVWNMKVPSIKYTFQIIQFEVKSRVTKLLSNKTCNRDRDWFSSL
ncbi:uncharacterized protein [Spinacia oleracea]|uniref:Reverse transcriptase zinc-binding domain-containing protein n=1 Tax=Spinacia oleracea TaxID=3562 RepID=A0ABM3QZ89_SPIOL|nr:uncharacterized protein LOC130463550 [Spinacia oleracea]